MQSHRFQLQLHAPNATFHSRWSAPASCFLTTGSDDPTTIDNFNDMVHTTPHRQFLPLHALPGHLYEPIYNRLQKVATTSRWPPRLLHRDYPNQPTTPSETATHGTTICYLTTTNYFSTVLTCFMCCTQPQALSYNPWSGYKRAHANTTVEVYSASTCTCHA